MKQIDRILLLSLFAGYTLKVSILGASLSDAAVILILAAANFLNSSQINTKQIDQLNQSLSDIQTEVTELKSKQDELKTSVASIKMTGGMLSKVR